MAKKRYLSTTAPLVNITVAEFLDPVRELMPDLKWG
jgi:hypothetical protein